MHKNPLTQMHTFRPHHTTSTHSLCRKIVIDRYIQVYTCSFDTCKQGKYTYYGHGLRLSCAQKRILVSPQIFWLKLWDMIEDILTDG